MEKRIQNKINTHHNTFKHSLKDWIIENIHENMNDDDMMKVKQQLINLVEFYPSVNLTHEDFNKRKRTKNNIPLFDRCLAKRASGSQCTRRKKSNCDYCGTHEKGQPHGIFDKENENIVVKQEPQKTIVETISINGINYYLDKKNNVYNPHDVLTNVVNPRVIASYEINSNEKGEKKYNLTFI